MDRANAQFWVAMLGMGGLVLITLASVCGTIWANAPNELTFMLVAGLLSATSAAAAWLFRPNNNTERKP